MKHVVTIMAILLLTFAVSCRRADTEDPAEQAARKAFPKLLNDAQIHDLINAKLQRDPDPVEAGKALHNALLELNRKNKTDNLYRAVYWFKLAQAYGQVLNTKEERKFARASKQLTELVQANYLFACIYAYKQNDQAAAASFFQDLLTILPNMGPQEDKNELRENVAAHIAWIKRFILTDK